jgi:hypothetical protein
MRTAPVRLLIGATFLVAGFGVISDGSPVRNPFTQAVLGTVDMKERQCYKTPVAIGSVCPKGCEARPTRSPGDRLLPTECHSPLWLATCGDACDAERGYARLEDGRLIDASRVLVVLDQELNDETEKEFADQQTTLTARFDGLFHYDALISSETKRPLEKTKKRLEALSGVRSVEYVLK